MDRNQKNQQHPRSACKKVLLSYLLVMFCCSLSWITLIPKAILCMWFLYKKIPSSERLSTCQSTISLILATMNRMLAIMFQEDTAHISSPSLCLPWVLITHKAKEGKTNCGNSWRDNGSSSKKKAVWSNKTKGTKLLWKPNEQHKT